MTSWPCRGEGDAVCPLPGAWWSGCRLLVVKWVRAVLGSRQFGARVAPQLPSSREQFVCKVMYCHGGAGHIPSLASSALSPGCRAARSDGKQSWCPPVLRPAGWWINQDVGGKRSCPCIATLPSDRGSCSWLEGNKLRGKNVVVSVRLDPSRAAPRGLGPTGILFLGLSRGWQTDCLLCGGPAVGACCAAATARVFPMRADKLKILLP